MKLSDIEKFARNLAIEAGSLIKSESDPITPLHFYDMDYTGFRMCVGD